MEYETVRHDFPPVYDARSEILILGSLPSVKSRELRFYYGHPQNRFWKVLALVTEQPAPESVEEKRAFLLRNRIAVWDVIARCDIVGSSDSSIRNVIPNDFRQLLKEAPIRRIYANGGKAYELYMKYAYPLCGREAVKLPSTSPANAAFPLERLYEIWKQIRLTEDGRRENTETTEDQHGKKGKESEKIQ